MTTSPYLSGAFQPQRVETEIEALPIHGEWPAALHGTLYRIGPNPQFEPLPPYNPLQGDGMVHAFHIRHGQVGYLNRWVRTRQWQLERAAGRALFATADPRGNDPSVRGESTDGMANTNLVFHGGRLLALEEGHLPLELDPNTLETRAPWDFHGALTSNMTAHPKIDPLTGEMIFFANCPHRRLDGVIEWYVAEPDGTVTGRETLQTPYPSLVHDFQITRDFVLFIICPLTLSLERVRAGQSPIAWEPDQGAHIAVIPRHGPGPRQARWFNVNPCYVWHTVNGWNDGPVITLDVCQQAAPAFPNVRGALPEPGDIQQTLWRWQVDLRSSAGVRLRPLSDLVCEYPRIDERRTGTRHHHAFFACFGGPGTGDDLHRGVACYNNATGHMTTHHFGQHCAVSEPVFVPHPGAGQYGWLLCVVYDQRSDTSALHVLRAGAVDQGPVARAEVGHRVPMTFHGLWRAATETGAGR